MLKNFHQRHLLSLLFLFISIAALISSVINWIASNWAQFTHLEKLSGMQGLTLLCIGVALYYFYRSRQYRENFTYQYKRAAAFFGLAMSLGALFALFGQSYQTGADPWQLFAIWALVQLPLLWLTPNIASTILLMVTLNLTVHFYTLVWFGSNINLFSLLGLNLILVCFTEIMSKKWVTPHRILPRVANVLLIACVGLSSWSSEFFSISNYLNYLLFFFTLGLVFYHKIYRDYLISTFYFFPFLISVNFLFIQHDLLSGIVFAIFFSLGAIFLYVKLMLNELISQQKINTNWLIVLPVSLATLVITALMLGLFLLMGERIDSLGVFSLIGLFIGVIGLYHKKSDSEENPFVELMANISLGIGQILGCIAIWFYDLENLILPLVVLVALFFHVVIYVLRSAIWLRIYSWLVLFHVIRIVLFNAPIEYSFFYTLMWMVQIIGTLFIFAHLKSENSHSNSVWLPFAWAGVWYFLIQSLPQHFYYWDYWDEPFSFLSEPIEVFTWQAFFSQVFGQQFEVASWLPILSSALITLLPLIILLWRAQALVSSSGKRVGLVVIGVLVGGWLLPNSIFTVAFCLLMLAVFNRQRGLFVTSVVLMILSMWNFYYSGVFPFLYKSIYMLIFAVILLFGYFLFHFTHHSNAEKQHFVGKDWLSAVCFALFSLSLLGGVAYKTVQYERVLLEGGKVILALAPRDPRSLMQGDYMALNYDILDDIAKNPRFDVLQTEGKHFAYAILTRDEQGIGTLVDIQSELVGNSEENQLVYIPIHFNQDVIRLPSQEYFFSEGKAEHYANAGYAEYRFSHGVALLSRLLDNDLNPL